MLTLEQPPEISVAATPMDTLFDLQLRVARRADELSRGRETSRNRDLIIWGEAEREILEAGAAVQGTMAVGQR